MTVADDIKVNTRYTRSTNVERDRGQLSIVEAYLPTSRAVHLLDDVAEALAPEDRPRAWNLVGPYGSGKSSFALFLHELLGETQGEDARVKETATGVLAKTDAKLADRMREQKPWCRVVLTGGNEPIARKLLGALADAATAFWGRRLGRKPAILDEINAARQSDHTPDSRILALVDDLQEALERSGAGGLLIVIDELGKFLEYAAHGDDSAASGVFLLQELAERAYRGRQANFMLFVLLHQGFDLYAQGLSEQRKNDWAKVQGRFESVSFIETVDQTLRVMAAAFSSELPPSQLRRIEKQATSMARALDKAKALPGPLTKAEAARLFSTCYPLHPVSLLALPVLCQRFAQNERTLFSYLGSREPHGFRDSLAALADGEWVQPDAVYDYFVHNQPAVLADPLTHRRWAEVVTAVERAEREASATEKRLGNDILRLAKTVGLLNLAPGTDGLRASTDVLRQLFIGTRGRFDAALEHLVDASIVQFRKFSGEYRVWQGTDFDIDEQTQIERDKLGFFDLATALSERSEIGEIVARRHSFDVGALRYFDVAFLDAQSPPLAASQDGRPRVVFFMADGRDGVAAFHERRRTGAPNDVWALNRRGTLVRAAIRDTLALASLQRSAQALASDPIATREIKERLAAAQRTERDTLRALLDDPASSEWYWQDERLDVVSHRALQNALSSIMDHTYEQSPVIQNELINRDRLSSQAAAARNKLFQHMLAGPDRCGLGIDKHPPELAIYRSILERGGLHVQTGDKREFVEPAADDPLHLRPVWDRLNERFATSESSGPVSAKDLMDDLSRPPFGLKKGVFPIIFLHYYLAHRYEIAFYDEGAYAPDLRYEHLERLVRHPQTFTFQRFRIDGVRASLFDEYSRALFGEVRAGTDVLAIARPLSHFILGLDEHARKTRRLSKTAVQVRETFLLSKSPEKLLFEELPHACGFAAAGDSSGLAPVLIQALRELKNAHADLFREMHSAFCTSFGLAEETSPSQLRTVLSGRLHGLDSYTVDTKGLKGFIRRLIDAKPKQDEWFARILLFLGHKPSDKWTDQDRDTAEYRLAEFSKRLSDLEKLRIQHDARGAQDTDLRVILLKTLSADGELDEVATINRRTIAATSTTVERVQRILREVDDQELALAVIAQAAEDFLAEYRQRQPELWRNHEQQRPAS
ncbi:MAG: hypothetical protein F4Y86_10315 [Gammaproteobacteria bacterium]|nr:hypothetical protein [Gammaproteobacteria bacterium]